MKKIFLSLWGSYADDILDVWANKEKSGLIVVILQFVNLSKVKEVVIVATVELIPQDIPWLKIPLTVQDSTGTLSLTLFDRATTKLLKKNASVLIEKHLSPSNSESISNILTEIPSQETLNFKASLESTDDNVTPFSQTEQGNGKRHAAKEATFKRNSKNPDFKRKLVDAYDIEETGALSVTKSVFYGKKTTLVSKVEK
ncbi:hypothetical protein L1987_19112 [Smallanthus sonchifolius]|uniref:Uncharacterized protein n=1 Tax=Smallanthus sonchifolius TaxID=185202 RepID=A0ACB9J1E5_9ASTR|nr:hypothetical protein L1987_19112 [Smallanthus sonchifolius]